MSDLWLFLLGLLFATEGVLIILAIREYPVAQERNCAVVPGTTTARMNWVEKELPRVNSFSTRLSSFSNRLFHPRKDVEIMPDRDIICVDCTTKFVFSEKEQDFFKGKNFQDPKRCKTCRKARYKGKNKPA